MVYNQSYVFLVLALLAGCGSRQPHPHDEVAHVQSVQQLEASAVFKQMHGHGVPWTVTFTWELLDDDPYGAYTIYFDYDDDNVRPHQNKRLERVVAFAQEIIARGQTVIVEGHAGLHGKKQWYNQRIAKRRAQSVARALIKHGIPKTSIKIFNRGQGMPAIDHAERTPDQQGSNRRVELYGISL